MKKNNTNFISLTNHIMFQKLFTSNIKLLKEMLISILKIDINPKTSKIKILDFNKYKNNNLLVSINNYIIIDIELNNRGIRNIKNTNIMYINEIISNISINFNNKNIYYFYQLNLNIKKESDESIENYYNYKFKDNICYNNIIIVNKYIAYYYNMYYTKKNNISKDIIWLALLKAKSYKELEEMAGKIMLKEEKQKFISKVKELNTKDFIINNSLQERLNKLADYEYEQNIKEQAYKEGIEQGYNDGIEDGYINGVEDETNKIIKKMLKENININTISKITEKSIDNIQKIAKFKQ